MLYHHNQIKSYPERSSNMKKFVFIILTLCILFGFAVYSEESENTEITEWTPSEMYSDEEIRDAIEVVYEDFRHWQGAELATITYTGDDISQKYMDWAAKYKADQTLVLISTVKTNIFSNEFEKNKIYDNFRWILIRKNGEKWSHVAHEY